MYNFIIKKKKIKDIAKLILVILYGYFVVVNLNIDFTNQSGDIGQLVRNADIKINNSNLTHEFLFYYLLNYLNNIFNIEYIDFFKFIAFSTSTIVFFIYTVNVNIKNYSSYAWPLLLIVFLTPRVFDLFGSGIRSGFAFCILFYAMIYLKGIKRYILFVTSIYIHLSMLPFAGLFFLFNFFKIIRVRPSASIYYLFLVILGIFAIFVSSNYYNLQNVAQSNTYQFLIFILTLFFIFVDKGAIKNIYGFLSIGIMSVVLIGCLFDLSFIRYIGNAILFYIFFLIENNSKRSFKLFFIAYLPFFVLTTLYSIPGIVR